jgi:hypothetical protein
MPFRRPLLRVGAPLSVLLLLTAVACSRPGADGVELCTQDGRATVCLRSDNGGPFKVSGNGFEPRSSLGVDLATGAGKMIPVDSQGRIPSEGGVLGFLPGPDAETHVLEGTDGAGTPVTFQVTCSLGDGKRPICRF